MKYIEFVRPHGHQHPKSIELDDRRERLYQLCIEHKDGELFTYEDCGAFINLCFEARVDVSDPDKPGEEIETHDVVCEIVSHECMRDRQRRLDAWAMTIAKAADHLGIYIPADKLDAA